MKLNQIRFKNYKAFKEKQELNIKPLTILIGKNSSGKSAIARLPLLLAKSLVYDANAPIELEFDGLEFGGSFQDLVHNRIAHGNISFEIVLEFGGSNLILNATIQNIADTPIQLISEYYIKYENLELSLKLQLENDAIDDLKNQLYIVKGILNDIHPISFNGLLIDPFQFVQEGKIPNFTFQLFNINQAITNYFSNIDYIGPFRVQPERDYIFKGTPPRRTGYFGELAPHILGLDNYFGRKITNAVGDWYGTHLGGWKLEVENIGNKFQIVLVSPDNPNVKINLRDVGHGMSQVLPFIVRSFMQPIPEPGLTIIEQPELHLHPAAHGGLAELIVNTILKEKSNWIIETHSEIFILTIRRLIAEGKLNATDVIIYAIEDEERPGSFIKPITIDEEGEVSDWPQGVFSEDYEEMLAIRRAQNNR